MDELSVQDSHQRRASSLPSPDPGVLVSEYVHACHCFAETVPESSHDPGSRLELILRQLRCTQMRQLDLHRVSSIPVHVSI